MTVHDHTRTCTRVTRLPVLVCCPSSACVFTSCWAVCYVCVRVWASDSSLCQLHLLSFFTFGPSKQFLGPLVSFLKRLWCSIRQQHGIRSRARLKTALTAWWSGQRLGIVAEAAQESAACFIEPRVNPQLQTWALHISALWLIIVQPTNTIFSKASVEPLFFRPSGKDTLRSLWCCFWHGGQEGRRFWGRPRTWRYCIT